MTKMVALASVLSLALVLLSFTSADHSASQNVPERISTYELTLAASPVSIGTYDAI